MRALDCWPCSDGLLQEHGSHAPDHMRILLVQRADSNGRHFMNLDRTLHEIRVMYPSADVR